MKKIFSILLLFSICTFYSCQQENENIEEDPIIATKTILMYLPYTGYINDLYPYFLDNINAIKKGIEDQQGLKGNAFFIFIAQDKKNAALIRVRYKGTKCVQDTLRKFVGFQYNQADHIARVLNYVKAEAPANNYAMLIGCHGMGWLKASTYDTNNVQEIRKLQIQKKSNILTRWFGGNTYMTDITTLADAITSANMKMQYILFDDCYLSNIETAYDLKDVTNYLVASTSEIMAIGMPYQKMWKFLSQDQPDYQALCNEFYNFYSTYQYPYGTLGITDCKAVKDIAIIMKNINAKFKPSKEELPEMQSLDGFTPSIFFDFGQYVNILCKDDNLKRVFNVQLKKLMPYATHTGKYYSAYTGKAYTINHFSGITISDPSLNSAATQGFSLSQWYIDTH